MVNTPSTTHRVTHRAALGHIAQERASKRVNTIREAHMSGGDRVAARLAVFSNSHSPSPEPEPSCTSLERGHDLAHTPFVRSQQRLWKNVLVVRYTRVLGAGV